jgi:hypothetical protein
LAAELLHQTYCPLAIDIYAIIDYTYYRGKQMKKIMFVIVLLLVSGFVQADSWLEVEWAFQFGWIPQGAINFYTPASQMETVANSFDSQFKIDAILFKIMKIGGVCITYFNSSTTNIITFVPTGMTYKVYIGIEPIKGISIYYEHECSHPVVAYYPMYQGSFNFDKYFDRIYIEIKSKISF